MKKKIGMSFVKFHAIMGALFGLVLGILYSFGGLIVDTLVTMGLVVTSETPGLSYGTMLAFGALIAMPIIFAVLGFIIGIIEVILYKIFSKWLNSLDIDF